MGVSPSGFLDTGTNFKSSRVEFVSVLIAAVLVTPQGDELPGSNLHCFILFTLRPFKIVSECTSWPGSRLWHREVADCPEVPEVALLPSWPLLQNWACSGVCSRERHLLSLLRTGDWDPFSWNVRRWVVSWRMTVRVKGTPRGFHDNSWPSHSYTTRSYDSAQSARPVTCEHSSRRRECKICSPNILCPHNRRHKGCRICSPYNFCIHNLAIKGCKICSQNSFCTHNLARYDCMICCPRIVCKHGGRKRCCKLCSPGLVCEHDKLRTCCRECGGSAYCPCLKLKEHCAEHGGSGLCIVCKFARHNPKFDKHCIDCFVNHYENDPRSDRHSKLMRRETVVRQAIDGVFKDFIHDKAEALWYPLLVLKNRGLSKTHSTFKIPTFRFKNSAFAVIL